MEEEPNSAIKLSPNLSRDKSGKSKLLASEIHSNKNLKKLYISIIICTLFMIAEIIGGLISGSLAIFTDAAHVFSDVLGFGISVISIHIARIPASSKMSFGYHRAEVIGALLSISIIWGLTAWLLSEAIRRIIHTSEVDGQIMVITAIAGLAGNIIMAFVLGHNHSHIGDSHEHHDHGNEHDHDHHDHHHHDHHNLNIQAAILHVVGDILQSVGVVIAGGIIFFYPHASIADPICTLVFSVIVMFTTIPIVKSCIKILMEATPDSLNSTDIEKDLRSIETVVNLHDLHIWSLSSGKNSLSCHIVSNDPWTCLSQAHKLLKEKHGIFHATIQLEVENELEDLDCLGDLHH